MSTHRQPAFAAAAAANETSANNPDPAIRTMADLVIDVATRLEAAQARHGVLDAVARCNSALENYLEAQRAERAGVHAISDDLKRLTALLAVVDRADVALVLRQIRRVLGRCDMC